MKPYGLPRNHDVGSPDCADIRHYGLKTSVGHVAKHGGDVRASQKSHSKRNARRIFKKRHRKHVQANIRKEIQDNA